MIVQKFPLVMTLAHTYLCSHKHNIKSRKKRLESKLIWIGLGTGQSNCWLEDASSKSLPLKIILKIKRYKTKTKRFQWWQRTSWVKSSWRCVNLQRVWITSSGRTLDVLEFKIPWDVTKSPGSPKKMHQIPKKVSERIVFSTNTLLISL